MGYMNRKQFKLGRPLRGENRRIRTSFTLEPKHLQWLAAESQRTNLSKCELLDWILSDAESRVTKLRGRDVTIRKNTSHPIKISYFQLETVCKSYYVKKMSIYGSVLRSDFSSKSDIDILVEFEDNKNPDYFKMAQLEKELERLLKWKKVDLKTPEDLSCYFRDEVVKEAMLIFYDKK